MKYLLDTNTCIYHLRNLSDSIAQRFNALEPENLCLCSVVKAELWYGALHSNATTRNLNQLKLFFVQFQSLHFDDKAAWHAANIRENLAAAGTPIGPYDMQIAAIALANDLSVVTNNVREFARVDGLRVENWLT